MFKWLKEWAKDYNEVQQALRDEGIFIISNSWGSFTTHIVNNKHDRSNTIQPNDTKSKVDR